MLGSIKSQCVFNKKWSKSCQLNIVLKNKTLIRFYYRAQQIWKNIGRENDNI